MFKDFYLLALKIHQHQRDRWDLAIQQEIEWYPLQFDKAPLILTYLITNPLFKDPKNSIFSYLSYFYHQLLFVLLLKYQAYPKQLFEKDQNLAQIFIEAFLGPAQHLLDLYHA